MEYPVFQTYDDNNNIPYQSQWNTMEPIIDIVEPPTHLDTVYGAYLNSESSYPTTGGEDLCGSDLNLKFFNDGYTSQYQSQMPYNASPAGSAFTASPPSTGRTSQSYLSPPCSPDAENVYDQSYYLSPNQVQGQYIDLSPISPCSPLIYQDYSNVQSSPLAAQWIPLPPPEPTAFPGLLGYPPSQDANQLGLVNFPQQQQQPQQYQTAPVVKAPTPTKPAQKTPLCQRTSKGRKPTSSLSKNAKTPYSSQSSPKPRSTVTAGPAPVVPLPQVMPVPDHSLNLNVSYKEGMYLFKKAHNKRKSVAGFCHLPIENFTTLDDFFDNFVSHPRRDHGIWKQCPPLTCLDGDLRSSDGNKDRGVEARSQKDPKDLFTCLLCQADFTAKHNVYFHIASHFNLKRTGTPCGELMGSDSDGSRHVKGCDECKATKMAHYAIPFEELRYTIVDGAKRTLKGWRFEPGNQ